jgi:hypothetical protein
MIERKVASISASGVFSESETAAIAEVLSIALGVEFKVTLAVEESIETPPLIVLALGIVGGAILTGFLGKMGSDAWDYAKRKVIETSLRHEHIDGTRIRVTFRYGGARVTCSLRTPDLKAMRKALDKLGAVLAEVRDLVDNDNLPGTEVYIYYRFRGGRWEIDDASVTKPEFDVVRFEYAKGTWVPVDAAASKLLKEFQRKMEEKRIT